MRHATGYIWGEPWEQCQQWEPLVIQQPETMSIEGFCCLLEAELTNGLSTFCTPLSLLSRPVRMLWLWRQGALRERPPGARVRELGSRKQHCPKGRRAGQVYAALEQALSSRQQALDYAWWVVVGL